MTEAVTAPVQSKRTLVTLLCLAQFMLIVDVTVVAVAIPSMQRQLHVSPADIQWVTTAYGIAFGGFLITAGRAADLFGSRRILLSGLALFTVASAACGFAPVAGVLFAARAVQGLGAALVSPAALALLIKNFAEGRERNRVLGLWGAVASAGGVTGNLAGGLLTGLLSWRWIFWVNVPIGVVVLLFAARAIARDRARTRENLDLPGALLLTAAVALLVGTVSQAAVQGLDAIVLVGVVSTVVLFAIFVVVESRVSEPIVKFRLFRNPNVRMGNVISVVSAAASAAPLFFSTLYLQEILGLSPQATGIGFVPVLVVIIVISSRAAPLVARFGVRRLLVAAALIVAVGLVMLAGVRVDGTYWVNILPGLLLVGAGSGLSLAPAMIVSTTGVPNEDQGLASGILNTAQQVGSALGVAVLNAVAVAVAGGAAIATAAATTDGYRAGFLWALAAPAIMILCVLRIPPSPASVPADGSREVAAPADSVNGVPGAAFIESRSAGSDGKDAR